jgi:acetyl-CoA acetyltransferase
LSASPLGRGVAIVAVGTTHQGRILDRGSNEIAVDALSLALSEAGIAKGQIDGLITCKPFDSNAGVDTQIGRLAGINPKYSATLDYGTCNFSLHLAAMVIDAGLATTVACLYGTNQKTSGNRFLAGPGVTDLSAPYGFQHVAGSAAMAFRRHQYLYGTTEAQLGEIAVSSRQWARNNPLAIFHDELTIQDYLASPYIVRPLRRPDLCMISDGGAALIVTSAERSRDFPKRPVYLIGYAQRSSLRQYENPDYFDRPWLRDVARDVYAMAELTPGDIDIAYIQDPTSVWVLQMLEAYGFCGQGEAGPFLQSGAIRPGGSLPVNTNGGQLSEAYMWGWLHLCEAVRQLRGECEARQVEGAKVALYCSTKGFEKGAASILSNLPPAP